MKRKLLATLCLVMAVFMLVTMNAAAIVADTGKISLNKSFMEMGIGQVYNLKTDVTPAGAAKTKLKWSSSNKNVVSVSATGSIKALKEGKAVISVTSANGKTTVKFNVTVNKNIKLSAAGVPIYPLTYVMWGYADQFQGGKKPKYFDLVANEINKKLLKDRGFQLQFIPLAFPMDTIAEKINLELAAGTPIDLIKLNGDIYTQFVNKKTVYDIKDLLNKSGQHILKWYAPNVWSEMSSNGKIWAIPQVDFPYFVGGWVRNDWLKKLGLSMPTTIAQLENVFKAIKNSDLDGNGKLDTLPMTGTLDYLINYLIGAYTTHPGDYIQNGNVKSMLEDPGYKRVLILLQKWYKDGYMDDSIFDQANTNIAADLFGKDKLGMEINSVWELEWGALNAVYKGRSDMDFKFLKAMSDVKSFPATNGIAGSYVFVPTTSRFPDIAIQYMDWLYESEDNYVLNQPGLGIKDKTYVLDSNFSPDLPKAEKDLGTKPGTLLSGPYSNLMIVQYNLKYMPAATPPQTRAAYDFIMHLDLTKQYVPITKNLAGAMTDNLKVKQGDCETVRKEYVQKIIKGQATYEEMIQKWKDAGGTEIDDAYTKSYTGK